MDRGAWQAAVHGVARDLATNQQQKLLAHVKFIVLFLRPAAGRETLSYSLGYSVPQTLNRGDILPVTSPHPKLIPDCRV